jgi:hypothetical protein
MSRQQTGKVCEAEAIVEDGMHDDVVWNQVGAAKIES